MLFRIEDVKMTKKLQKIAFDPEINLKSVMK